MSRTLVPINCIAPDPEAPKWPHDAPGPKQTDPVVVKPYPGVEGRYLAVVGWRSVAARQALGEAAIAVDVREDLTPEKTSELQLTEYYVSGIALPMDFANALCRHVQRFEVSLSILSNRTGITAGTLHHYLSLVKDLAPALQRAIGDGRLTFKEGRALADIHATRGRDHDRQLEIARPFLERRLSSSDVEHFVQLAKEYPAESAEALIERLPEQAKKHARRVTSMMARLRPDRPSPVDIPSLEAAGIEYAAALDSLRLQPVPEYERARVTKVLVLLDAKVEEAIAHLAKKSYQSNDGMPIGAAR